MMCLNALLQGDSFSLAQRELASEQCSLTRQPSHKTG